VAQEVKMLAHDHKNTFRFFCKRQHYPWWGPSGPMAEDRRPVGSSARRSVLSRKRTSFMVDDDTLVVELWRRFLKDPRTSDAEIRRLSRLALLRYKDFRLQLIAWSLDPPASLLPDSAAVTSQLQHHEPVRRKDRAVPLECTECRARYIAVLDDDPPDWRPHCIECDTPFGPVLDRAVYSLFAVID
jgi:hypothetical protein